MGRAAGLRGSESEPRGEEAGRWASWTRNLSHEFSETGDISRNSSFRRPKEFSQKADNHSLLTSTLPSG